jgi:hypothetical protein
MQAISGLDMAEIPSLNLLMPAFDEILSREIDAVFKRLANTTLLKKLSVCAYFSTSKY